MENTVTKTVVISSMSKKNYALKGLSDHCTSCVFRITNVLDFFHNTFQYTIPLSQYMRFWLRLAEWVAITQTARDQLSEEVPVYIIPLKVKRICFIYGLSAYRVVNTFHFIYKNQSLYVL
jgi:hypothetical protein